MSTNRGTQALILLFLIFLGLYISPDSAKAEEPAEDTRQELIRGDARAASTMSWRAPFLGLCKMQENKKSDQSPAQSGPGTPANDTIWSLPAFSSYCKLYDLLARGEFEVRKVGCIKSQNSLGFNCDFIIQPKTPDGGEAAIVSQFFNPSVVHTSRFVLFESKWYLAAETSPLFGAGPATRPLR